LILRELLWLENIFINSNIKLQFYKNLLCLCKFVLLRPAIKCCLSINLEDLTCKFRENVLWFLNWLSFYHSANALWNLPSLQITFSSKFVAK
jgi:hypothetical protein